MVLVFPFIRASMNRRNSSSNQTVFKGVIVQMWAYPLRRFVIKYVQTQDHNLCVPSKPQTVLILHRGYLKSRHDENPVRRNRTLRPFLTLNFLIIVNVALIIPEKNLKQMHRIVCHLHLMLSDWWLDQLVQEALTHKGVMMGARGGKHDRTEWPRKCRGHRFSC